MSGSKRPRRDKIIRLCIAAELNLEETQSALEAGGEALLSSMHPRDLVISYAISHNNGIMEINALLSRMNVELLG